MTDKCAKDELIWFNLRNISHVVNYLLFLISKKKIIAFSSLFRNLHGYSLEGTLAPELGNLTHLRSM